MRYTINFLYVRPIPFIFVATVKNRLREIFNPWKYPDLQYAISTTMQLIIMHILHFLYFDQRTIRYWRLKSTVLEGYWKTRTWHYRCGSEPDKRRNQRPNFPRCWEDRMSRLSIFQSLQRYNGFCNILFRPSVCMSVCMSVFFLHLASILVCNILAICLLYFYLK